MLAKEILNIDFTPLQPGSTVSSALAKMDAWHSSSIPVVEPVTRKHIGQIVFDEIADQFNGSQPISDFNLVQPVHAFENQHVFEIARQMLQHEIRLLAVIDSSETYIGVIEKKQVLEALSRMLNITSSGSVITVGMAKADFTLSELVHLIEAEGARILGLTVESTDGENQTMQISLKISHQDTSAVTSSLRRHGYLASTENRDDLIQIDLANRADELIRFLDV